MSPIDVDHYQSVLDFLNEPGVLNDGGSCVSLTRANWKPFDLMPQDFLRFAESDLQSSLPHRHINALANTKRALDCQLDCFLKALGLFKVSRSQRWGFRRKLGTVEDVGLLTPRILQKISRARNILEHEFAEPTPEAVEDALDTASIFVAYTDHLFQAFPTEVVCVRKVLDHKRWSELMDEYTDGRRSGKVTVNWDQYTGQSSVRLKFDWYEKTLRIGSCLQGEIKTAVVKPVDAAFLELFKVMRAHATLG